MRTLAGIVVSLVVIESAAQNFTAPHSLESLHFSPFGSLPYFVLNPGHRIVLQGEEAGEQIELTITPLNQTKEITLASRDGPRAISARVIEEREVVNGTLSEVARLWYARSIETGDVYLFGEEVDFYFNGEVVGQKRLWEAGVDGGLPGMVMPGTFLLGARYYQNQAVAAVDGAENIALGLTVATPAGIFTDCVQVRETDLLRPDLGTTLKTYAPGIGLVQDDNDLLLREVHFGAVGLPAQATFTPFSHHRFFPVSPGRRSVLEGKPAEQQLVLTITVLEETRTLEVMILGAPVKVPTRLIEERRFADGQLVEVARHFVAQCVETGDVHYFGKEVDRYAGGEVVSHEGTWLAGLNGAEAGILMPANLTLGARYFQQTALGVSRDLAVNAASELTVTVPAGTFSRCVRIAITSSLETNGPVRALTYAPGLGLISDGDVLKLTSVTDGKTTAGTPVLSIQDAVLLSWPFTDQPFGLQSSSDLQTWIDMPQIHQPADGRNQIALPRAQTKSWFRLKAP